MQREMDSIKSSLSPSFDAQLLSGMEELRLETQQMRLEMERQKHAIFDIRESVKTQGRVGSAVASSMMSSLSTPFSTGNRKLLLGTRKSEKNARLGYGQARIGRMQETGFADRGAARLNFR